MGEDGMLLTFGDIFSFNGREYVYLAASPESDIVYAACILSRADSRDLNRLFETRQRSGKVNKDSLVYCFVVLKSTDYLDQIAWFAHTGQDGAKASKPHNTLEDEDLRRIKQEILSDASPLPEDLKEKVRLTTSSEL